MERSRSTVKEYGFPLFTSFENPDEVKRSDQKCQQYFLTELPDLPTEEDRPSFTDQLSERKFVIAPFKGEGKC